VRKGNFLKYKNQYFFYKKTVCFIQAAYGSKIKKKKHLKTKKPPRYRDGFLEKNINYF
jgi:hypothetical protein